jgi:hypothetical protein
MKMTNLKAMHHIVSKDPPVLCGDYYSEELIHFVGCCLQKNPNDRSSAE